MPRRPPPAPPPVPGRPRLPRRTAPVCTGPSPFRAGTAAHRGRRRPLLRLPHQVRHRLVLVCCLSASGTPSPAPGSPPLRAGASAAAPSAWPTSTSASPAGSASVPRPLALHGFPCSSSATPLHPLHGARKDRLVSAEVRVCRIPPPLSPPRCSAARSACRSGESSPWPRPLLPPPRPPLRRPWSSVPCRSARSLPSSLDYAVPEAEIWSALLCSLRLTPTMGAISILGSRMAL